MMNYLKPHGNVREKNSWSSLAMWSSAKSKCAWNMIKVNLFTFCVYYTMFPPIIINIQVEYLGNFILDPYNFIPNGLNNSLESLNLYNL
jgi:hypothetical protein